MTGDGNDKKYQMTREGRIRSPLDDKGLSVSELTLSSATPTTSEGTISLSKKHFHKLLLTCDNATAHGRSVLHRPAGDKACLLPALGV